MKEKLPPTLLPAAGFAAVATPLSALFVHFHSSHPLAWPGVPGIIVGAVIGGWSTGSFYPGGPWWIIVPVGFLANTLLYAVVFAIGRAAWRLVRP